MDEAAEAVEPTVSDGLTQLPCGRCGAPVAVGDRCPICEPSERAPGDLSDPSHRLSAEPADRKAAFPGYLVLCRVAHGGMGEVWKAHPVGFPDDLRALKVLRPDLSDSTGELRRRFQAEVIALQRLSDPGIVRVHGVGECPDGRPVLVMQWVEGRTLLAALSDPLSPIGQPEAPGVEEHAVVLAQALARALDEAHAHKVVHRDIKPSNVILASEPPAPLTPVLVDFGIAWLGGGSGSGQAPGAIGTVAHLAPEVARGEPATARSDVFMLAQLVYQALTGIRYSGGAPRPPSQINPRLSTRVDALFTAAMANDPNDRPASCGAFADTLTEVTNRSRATGRRRRASIRLAVAILAALAALLGGLLGGRLRDHVEQSAVQPQVESSAADRSGATPSKDPSPSTGGRVDVSGPPKAESRSTADGLGSYVGLRLGGSQVQSKAPLPPPDAATPDPDAANR